MNPVALHAIYILTAIVAITVLLLAGIAADVRWCRNVFRPWDYLGAAVFGGDGKHSISAYCGRAILTGGPAILVALGAVVDFIFGRGHCTQAAQKENLV